MLSVNRTYHRLELESLKFYAHKTRWHTRWHFCSRKVLLYSDEEEVKCASQSQCLFPSVWVSGYLFKYAVTHIQRHTHSLWLIRESWQGLLWSYTTWRYIILLRSWVNCWTFTRIFPEGSIVWNTFKKKNILRRWGGWRKVGASWYWCTNSCTSLW